MLYTTCEDLGDVYARFCLPKICTTYFGQGRGRRAKMEGPSSKIFQDFVTPEILTGFSHGLHIHHHFSSKILLTSRETRQVAAQGYPDKSRKKHVQRSAHYLVAGKFLANASNARHSAPLSGGAPAGTMPSPLEGGMQNTMTLGQLVLGVALITRAHTVAM